MGLSGEPARDVLVDRSAGSGGVSSLVSGGGYLWVGDSVTSQVFRVDPERESVSVVDLHQNADELLFAGGRLWVLDKLAGHLTRIDPSTAHASPPFTIAGDLRGLAVEGGYVWVVDASDNTILRIPEDLGSPPTAIAVGDKGGPPKAVAHDDGAIVVGFEGGVVEKVNVSISSSPSVIWSRQVGNNVSSIAVDQGIVWTAGGPLSNL
jgi:DNA-binding beta-propeller fold protein YncE